MADLIPLDTVHWVPAKTPPHKNERAISPAEHRVALLELIIDMDPRWELCRFELESEQPPWTVFLLERFKREYPGDKLHLLIGGDSLAELTTWRDYRRLWELAEIDVAVRPGWKLSEVDEEVVSNVVLIPCPQIEIGSTEIRGRIRRGEPVDGLVPARVLDYIVQNGLFSNILHGSENE